MTVWPPLHSTPLQSADHCSLLLAVPPLGVPLAVLPFGVLLLPLALPGFPLALLFVLLGRWHDILVLRVGCCWRPRYCPDPDSSVINSIAMTNLVGKSPLLQLQEGCSESGEKASFDCLVSRCHGFGMFDLGVGCCWRPRYCADPDSSVINSVAMTNRVGKSPLLQLQEGCSESGEKASFDCLVSRCHGFGMFDLRVGCCWRPRYCADP